MKKNTIKVAFVAAFAIVAGYNVYNSQKTDVMSDLALENVEALAQSESSNGIRVIPEMDIHFCVYVIVVYGVIQGLLQKGHVTKKYISYTLL